MRNWCACVWLVSHPTERKTLISKTKQITGSMLVYRGLTGSSGDSITADHRFTRPPEAPMKVSPKISIFEGQFWSNPSPNLAYFWVKITPCFPVVSIFEGSLGLARGSLGFLWHLPIQKFWSTCNRILKNPFCLQSYASLDIYIMESLNFSSLTTDQHVRQTQNIQNISQDHVKN